MTYDVIDLFAGGGGWDQGFAQTSSGHLDLLGIEYEKDACETGKANGHKRLQQDISLLEPLHYGMVEHHPLSGWKSTLKGLIASPPCPGFSSAGKGLGRKDLDMLVQGIGLIRMGADVDKIIADVRRYSYDDRSALTLEPLRWALGLRPNWTVWEQVPAVLPIWEACAKVLREAGYSVWVGKLGSEQFGVPQTRTRAILIASRTRVVAPPKPSHSKFYSRDRQRLDSGVKKWVSMADALQWTDAMVGFPRKSDGRDEILIDGEAYRARDMRSTEEPSQVVTEKARSWKVVSGQTVGGVGRAERSMDEPALTVTSKIEPAATLYTGTKGHVGNIQFCGAGITSEQTAGQKPRDADEPAHTITGKGTAAWKGEMSRRVTVQEASMLQSFPEDYIWCGSKTSQFQQCGNAIPVLLAQRILETVL